jgi:ribosomal protein L19E
VILGLILFCRKLTNNLIRDYRDGGKFDKKHWKMYYQLNKNIIIRIEKDENYLEDYFIDYMSEKSQLKIK